MDALIVSGSESFGNNTNLPIGYPCSTNTECNSGNCVNSQCSLAFFNQACNADSNCLSQSCVLNKCTNEGFASNAKYQSGLYIGTDSNSQNLFWIVIIIIIMFIIIIYGFIEQKILLSLIISGTIGLILFITFTIIGFISGFILLMFFLFCLVISFIVFMIKGNSGG